MEGCWKSSSGSTRLLWLMVPLILMCGLVALGGVGLKGWNFYPWIWNVPVMTTTPLSAHGVETTPNVVVKNPVLEKDDGGVTSNFLPSTVVSGVTTEELVKRSASPPPQSMVTEESQHVLSKEENFNVTALKADVSLPFNETHALPPDESTRIKRRFTNLERLEAKLGQARVSIREARNENQSYDPDHIPVGPIYNDANTFHRSYLEMEKQFKIFVYEEGEPPIFHDGPCKSIYASEGNFIYYMESTKFRTRDPNKAHVFFLPMSVAKIVSFVYVSNSHDWLPMRHTVRDYIKLIGGNHPFWNRSLGADHFMLACHDWGPELSKSVPQLYENSIRALCNANTSEGFNPSKDVSIPEIHLRDGTLKGLIGGPSPSQRPYLVFFAGGLHGPIRPILLKHWENRDEDVQVHQYLKKGISYYGMMRKSKYCICPSGYEVASPRMVEALYTGCVPVLIKDHYVPPFSDVLNWKAFAIEIPVKDIPNLKSILMGISSRQYIRLQRRGKQARRHFEVNLPPKRYDVFHMILHSIWLRRLNIRIHGVEDS